jgi:hypothetical protein
MTQKKKKKKLGFAKFDYFESSDSDRTVFIWTQYCRLKFDNLLLHRLN